MQEKQHQSFIREAEEKHNVIVFIHGILGTPHHFQDFLPLVPASWSVYNILLDGHGQDVQALADTSMAKWKQQIDSLMTVLAQKYDRIFITAHSMGTLFAMNAALQWPEKVQALFLIAVPLKVWVKKEAVVNSLKVILNRVDPEDKMVMAAKRAYSITPDPRLWGYLGWIPRYIELLREIQKTRKKVQRLCIPGMVFQSQKDELVARSAAKYFRNSSKMTLYFLEQSGHFYYEKQDYHFLLQKFQEFCQ